MVFSPSFLFISRLIIETSNPKESRSDARAAGEQMEDVQYSGNATTEPEIHKGNADEEYRVQKEEYGLSIQCSDAEKEDGTEVSKLC